MKINGNTIAERTRRVRLPQHDFELVVAAYPIGLELIFASIWPEPVPRTKTVMSAGGKRSLEPILDDPKFQAEKDYRDLGLKAFYFREALRRDTSIEWEVSELKTRADIEAFIEEMKASNLTNDEVVLIFLAARELCGDLEEGQEIEALFV